MRPDLRRPAPRTRRKALAQEQWLHDVPRLATKKMGPSFKDIAAKYKGKADAEATLVANLKAGKGHRPSSRRTPIR